MRFQLPSGTAASRALVPGATRGLVIIPDIMGLRPLFDDMVTRLSSEWGWSTCCAELYPGHEHLELEERFAHAASLSDDDVLGDVVAAADATESEAVGVLGFCMGGMYTIKAVSTGRFAAAVSFYGMIRVPDDWRGDEQGEPLELLAQGDPATLLAIIGEADPYTPEADVNALRASGAAIASYPEAEHGFVHDPDRPAHRAEDASDAWRRAGEWLTR